MQIRARIQYRMDDWACSTAFPEPKSIIRPEITTPTVAKAADMFLISVYPAIKESPIPVVDTSPAADAWTVDSIDKTEKRTRQAKIPLFLLFCITCYPFRWNWMI